MSEISVERKITFQTFGKPDKTAKEVPQTIMQVIGYVDSYNIGSGTYGDYPTLYGDFLAVSGDGKKARAGKCILPMWVFDQFRSALDAGQTRIELGLLVSTRPSEKGNQGYEWVVKPLFAPKEADDPLLLMASKVPGLALSGPSEECLVDEEPPKSTGRAKVENPAKPK